MMMSEPQNESKIGSPKGYAYKKYTYVDQGPKQMDAVRKTEEMANTLFTARAQELLQNLMTPDGQKVSLQELLLGPAKTFGEILALQIDAYYTNFFDRPEIRETFASFVHAVFRQIMGEVDRLRNELKQGEQDPSRGTLPTIDQYTANIFASSFLRAKQKKTA